VSFIHTYGVCVCVVRILYLVSFFKKLFYSDSEVSGEHSRNWTVNGQVICSSCCSALEFDIRKAQ
jgi:hypothetical protein